MTIRIHNLSIQPDDNCWIRADFPGAVDAINDETQRLNMLSCVRHIMRERGDCTMIPVVRGFITHPENEWGHNAQIEVTYHATRGYRAIYGAHIGGTVSRVQCYMD